MPTAQLEPGRYVCVRTGGWLAWLIRVSCRSPYNHAVIVTGDGTIIEARPEGVREGTVSEYAGSPACANLAEPMTQAQRDAAVAKARALLGAGYNYPALVSIGLADIGWHWRWLIRLAGADKMLICSQLVSDCGAAAGLDWGCGKTGTSQVTPADLARRPGVIPVSL
jgi:uncharacterized protein YycO